jgi:trehalose/maltose hydrolase-like predicted phosphorylase
MLDVSSSAWAKIWDEIDIEIHGDRQAQKLLRLHLYHLMVSMSPHNKNIDASITARGLHGEAYRGHIFWDEIFILPLYNIHLPETARAMLMYRYHRLEKAREYAAEYGYKGAMFPWQSGSDGREETQVIHLNPLSGSWDPDHSSLQRHVSLAIAYNIWLYYHTTNDLQFMRDYGLEMFLEICRFWASKCNWNPSKQKYDLTKVMGPDEFHEQYPDSTEGGINNNTYTNLMTAWLFGKAHELLNNSELDSSTAINRTGVNTEELGSWKHISENLYIETDTQGILAQYEGYFELKELDWELYKQKYGNIYRMDRILKAEGLSPDEYKVSKQADLLMIYYLLDKEEVDSILKKLGIALPADYLQRNLEYYFNRTSHGSTLSRVVHSKLALMAGNKNMSLQLYNGALTSDFNDIQGGTTAEGIHAGVMAGTVLLALQNYTGLDLGSEIVKFEPNLPENWQKVSFNFSFKGINYKVVVEHNSVRVTTDHEADFVVFGQKNRAIIN